MILTYQIQIYVLFYESSNKEYCYKANVYQTLRCFSIKLSIYVIIKKKENRICFCQENKICSRDTKFLKDVKSKQILFIVKMPKLQNK